MTLEGGFETLLHPIIAFSYNGSTSEFGSEGISSILLKATTKFIIFLNKLRLISREEIRLLLHRYLIVVYIFTSIK